MMNGEPRVENEEPVIALRENNMVMTARCAVCGGRCDPVGLDYMLGRDLRPCARCLR